MLTSLLTLYIAGAIEPNLDLAADPIEKQLVRTASLSFSSLVENDVVPIQNSEMISPVIEADSSIAVDKESGKILYEKNIHDRLQIGSITKLMTILIILEENRFDETTKVSKNAASIEGSHMNLVAGEEISIKNLLYGALINSANDAAVALAEYNAGSVDAFVEKMNARANELGLLNTHFSNPIGLDNSKNYSSAYDVSELAKYIYHNKFIQEAAVIKNMDVQSADGTFTHKLQSTNELLDSYLKIKGLKTGTTGQAGPCNVAIAENENGNEIITVVLNSPNRFQESKILIDWIFRAYNWL